MADPPHSSKPDSSEPERKPAGRPERSRSTNMFWYLLAGVVVLVLVVAWMEQSNKRVRRHFSEFKKQISAGDLHKGNVFELTISDENGSGVITYQDRPKRGRFDTSKPRPKKYYVPVVGASEEINALTTLLDEKKIIYGFDEPRSEWPAFFFMLFTALLLFLAVLFVIRRIGGAGSAMSFGRSRGRFYAQDDLDISFEDVAGINEAVEELREVVEFLRTPTKYQALGARIPRGVLLVGPPGTGKTLLAKAVAGEAGVPFFSLSGSDFVEMFVGVGASRVRDMFVQAVAKAPSIIFIDELDALGKVRGSGNPGGHDERDQTLNALLVEMDGFHSDQSVIVLAATNRPETLDPALLRPGRFDRHVLVDRPDFTGRKAILDVHIGKIRLDDNVDLERVARLTPGFVGADLANLVNEAALLAARNNKTKVTMTEFEEGIERVVAGLEKQTRIIAPEEKQRVAYHECGHALVASSLPHTDPVHKISIVPRGMAALGYTLQFPDDERHLATQTELQHRICVLLGGIAAEEIIFQEISTGAQNDLERATDIARRMVGEFGMSAKMGRVNYLRSGRSPFLAYTGIPASLEPFHSEETAREFDLEVKRIIDGASKTAGEVLNERRELLEHMSRELLENEVMDHDQLQAILDQHKTRPHLKPGTYATPGLAAEDSETGADPAADSTAAEGG